MRSTALGKQAARSVVVLASTLCFIVSSATAAAAAVPPVPYTGSIYIDYGSAGGVLLRNGVYYLMTVGHVAGNLYTQHSALKPSSYPLGGTAYSAYYAGNSREDIALIELGTNRPNPHLRVCNRAQCPTPPGYTIPQIATIDNVPTGADLPYGRIICFSGWSTVTETNYGGYRCGIADNQNDQSCAYYCGITNINGPNASMVDNGDSGGPVWQPLPNGHVRLLGFISLAFGPYPYQHAGYQPIWHYWTHNWTTDQSCDYCSKGPGGSVVTGN